MVTCYEICHREIEEHLHATNDFQLFKLSSRLTSAVPYKGQYQLMDVIIFLTTMITSVSNSYTVYTHDISLSHQLIMIYPIMIGAYLSSKQF